MLNLHLRTPFVSFRVGDVGDDWVAFLPRFGDASEVLRDVVMVIYV